ncbi:retrovirus-related pol polyprotein from transposon TNT 1-94 [Tanacetum coccineum]
MFSLADTIVTSQQGWDSYLRSLYDEFFNMDNSRVNKSSSTSGTICSRRKSFHQFENPSWGNSLTTLWATIIHAKVVIGRTKKDARPNCTDIAKISRKRSKSDKHEHGNGRAHKEPGESYKKSRMVNSKLLYHRLRKALYGLKQAPRAWYDKLSNFLMSKGFTKGTIDPTLFTIRYGKDILLVKIYVDDIIIGSTNPKFSKRFENYMHSRFEMSLIGEMKLFLGLQIHQSPRGIFINQAKYALEILKKHGMDKCDTVGRPMATKPKLDADLSGKLVDQTDYRSKIGSLMYLTSSRPDIVQAVCYCARYQARPIEKHLKEVKRIFRYLRGDKLVSWMSKKQECTAMSSSEAEYVALSASCAQVIWIRTRLIDYGFNYNKIPLYCDSQSAIAISCNPVQHSHTKHIRTRYHFIKEQVENDIIELYFVRTEYQLADMFTKALPEDRFQYLVRRIGMRCLTPAELEVLANESA